MHYAGRSLHNTWWEEGSIGEKGATYHAHLHMTRGRFSHTHQLAHARTHVSVVVNVTFSDGDSILLLQ